MRDLDERQGESTTTLILSTLFMDLFFLVHDVNEYRLTSLRPYDLTDIMFLEPLLSMEGNPRYFIRTMLERAAPSSRA